MQLEGDDAVEAAKLAARKAKFLPSPLTVAEWAKAGLELTRPDVQGILDDISANGLPPGFPDMTLTPLRQTRAELEARKQPDSSI